MIDTATPVVFIHGLWLHATSWRPWVDLFAARGFAPVAPGWPGEPVTVEAARADAEAVANVGIDAITDHYAQLIAELPAPPILIGHSFGGMIAQKLLGRGIGAAAIAIDAAQFKGVLPLPLSSLHATLPVFKNPGNKHHAVMLDADQFQYAFGNELPRDESDALWDAWVVPSPALPLFQAATANFSLHSEASVDTRNEDRGPLLLIAGGKDHTVPEVITKAELKAYRKSSATTEFLEFADRGHSLTIDHGWREVADAALSWITEQKVGVATAA
ncbi:MAG: alpha/beta hydrolase [Pseudolysinimonas sp.]